MAHNLCVEQGPFYIPLFNSLLGFGAHRRNGSDARTLALSRPLKLSYRTWQCRPEALHRIIPHGCRERRRGKHHLRLDPAEPQQPERDAAQCRHCTPVRASHVVRRWCWCALTLLMRTCDQWAGRCKCQVELMMGST